MATKKGDTPPDESRVNFTLRLPQSLMDALVQYCNDQRFKTSKQAVIEKQVELLLIKEGYWQPPGASNSKDDDTAA